MRARISASPICMEWVMSSAASDGVLLAVRAVTERIGKGDRLFTGVSSKESALNPAATFRVPAANRRARLDPSRCTN
jgi:hypothetical protein